MESSCSSSVSHAGVTSQVIPGLVNTFRKALDDVHLQDFFMPSKPNANDRAVPVSTGAGKKGQAILKVSSGHLGSRLASLSQVADDEKLPTHVCSLSIRQLRCQHNIIKARPGWSMFSPLESPLTLCDRNERIANNKLAWSLKKKKEKNCSWVIDALSPAVMFHPRCQKAHDFNMTSVSSEVRPRQLFQTRHPEEGSLISCRPACVCACVSECLCGFPAAPSGYARSPVSWCRFWATTPPCFAAFAQCVRGTVGDEREKLRLVEN